MADERRSDREVASALGSLITGVERARMPVMEPDQEPDDTELELDTTVDADASDDVEDVLDLDDEADPDDDAEGTFLTLVHNGEEHPVTQSEAQTLAQKGMHFEKSMNALSAERREWEQKRAQIEEELFTERQEYAAVLPLLKQQVQSYLGEEPDWIALSEQVPPQEFIRMQTNWNQARKKLEAAQAEEQRVQQLIQQQQAQRMQQWREREAELTLTRIPEWKDEKTRTAQKAEIESYLLGLGLPREAINEIHDHLFWQVLRDAVHGRQAASAGSREVKNAGTKAIKPGSGEQKSSRGRRRERQRQKARQGGGRVEDIAPLMTALISK